jgi:hypothetical protein
MLSTNLIHENDTGLMIFSKTKHFTDNAGRFANVLVDNGRGDYLEKGGGDVRGKCTG